MTSITQFQLHLSAPTHVICMIRQKFVNVEKCKTGNGRQKATTAALAMLNRLYPSLRWSKSTHFPNHSNIIGSEVTIVEYETGRLVVQEKISLSSILKTRAVQPVVLTFEYHIVDREKMDRKAATVAKHQEDEPVRTELESAYIRLTNASDIRSLLRAKLPQFDRIVRVVVNAAKPKDVREVKVLSVQGDGSYPCALLKCRGKRLESNWGGSSESVTIEFDIYVALQKRGAQPWIA